MLVLEHPSAPDDIQRQVARRAHDPGGRILRHSIKRPGLQSTRQRFLDNVFGILRDPRVALRYGEYLRLVALEKDSKCLFVSGKPSEALGAAEAASKISGSSPEVLDGLARNGDNNGAVCTGSTRDAFKGLSGLFEDQAPTRVPRKR